MRGFFAGLLTVTMLVLASNVQAFAAKKVALVIGNAAYEKASVLKNPRNDAADLTKKLESLEFKVFTGLDLGHRAMRRTVEKFLQSLSDAEVALFFYAGHALQVNGQNYLVPVDAELQSHLDLNFETIPINFVLSNMEQFVKTNIVFLDACRDNPLSKNLSRSMGTRSAAVGQGLASIGTGVGTLVGFATEPGNVALDGIGRNSPYTTALLEHLGTPGEGLVRNLVNVRNAVLSATGGKQVPWEHSSLTGEVVLQPKAVVAPKPIEQPTAKPDPTVELAYWDSIKDADTKVYFETYVKRYPEGLFKDIALLKIAELSVKEAAVADAVQDASETGKATAKTKTSDNKVEEAEIVAKADTKKLENAEKKPIVAAVETTEQPEKKADQTVEVTPGKPVAEAPETQVKVEEAPKPSEDTEAANNAKKKAAALKLAKAALQEQTGAVEPEKTPEPSQEPQKVEPVVAETVEPEKTGEETKLAALEPTEPEVQQQKAEIVEPLTGRALIKGLQVELNRLGCSAGRADGIWGRGSKRALRKYNDNAATKLASLDPSAEVLDALKSNDERICPLSCRRGFKVVGDKCERVKRSAAVDPKGKTKTRKKAVKPRSTKRRTKPRQTKRRARIKTRWCYQCPQTVNNAARVQCFKKKQPNVMQDGRFCRAI